MEKTGPIQIDVEKVIRAKVPGYAKFIPKFVYRKIAHTIRQDGLNRVMRENYGKRGVEFAIGALKSFGADIEVIGEENIPTEGRYIFASNHPLGGLDGIALIALLGKYYNGNVKCIVNDLLMAVEPMQDVFLPINKHGAQSKQSIQAIDDAYASDLQMIMFPAGLCSRRNEKGEVCDLEWKKSFISKSIESKRDIVPVHFGGLNSDFFYKFARFRKRMGIKLNIEMVRLPAEMFRCDGQTFKVKIGKPIPYSTFTSEKSQKEWAADVKKIVYEL